MVTPPGTRPTRAAHRKHGGDRRPPTQPSGLVARQLAVTLISAVMDEHRTFDDAWTTSLLSRTFAGLEPRDRAFARAIAATVLRRHGELATVVSSFIDKPLPERRGRLSSILMAGAAQMLVLATPPHAAISLAVDQCRLDRDARRFDKLANAVLRRVSERGAERLAALDAAEANIPAWLLQRWCAAYGPDLARSIAAASLREAPLDLTVKADGAGWAERLGGVLLPTGSVRLSAHGRTEEIPGYGDGLWWVQDTAATLPARLLGDVTGLAVADLCAAPGGKTAQLAAAGAHVTAVDASTARLKRVTENLQRLQLTAELVTADVTTWSPGRTFDAVLLDAPCTATGTIRRHPDILHLKRETDLAALADLQARMLSQAATLVKAGGTLLYCTCSLEPQEGADQISAFLQRHPGFERVPLTAGEAGLDAGWITPAGDLRTLPCHLPMDTPELSGMDGFFAARLRRTAP